MSDDGRSYLTTSFLVVLIFASVGVNSIPIEDHGATYRRLLKLGNEDGLGGNSGNGIIPDPMERLYEEGVVGGNGDWGTEPLPPFGRSDAIQGRPSKRWNEEGLGGNSGNGIIPELVKRLSIDRIIGGNGDWETEPFPPFGRSGTIQNLPLKRGNEEGLGGNSGNGIFPDPVKQSSEDRIIEGNGDWDTEPLLPFGRSHTMKGRPLKRWNEEGLSGNSGNGIIPDLVKRLSMDGIIGGNGDWETEPFPPFGRSGTMQDFPLKRGNDEGLGGNTGNGIIPDLVKRFSMDGIVGANED